MTPMLLSGALVADELPENVRPGWTALIIVFIMGVALALLMWSMVRQFRKVNFDEDGDDESVAGQGDTNGVEQRDEERESNGSAH